MVAQMTPKKAEELLSRVGMMQPSKSSLDRLPKGLSARWEENREEFELELQNAIVIPENAKSVAVSLDGVFAPMEGTDPVGKRNEAAVEGRTLHGPAGYREAGVATVSFCDERGDAISAVRFARAPEPKKVTLKRSLLSEVLAVFAKRRDLNVVKIADGTKDNWEYLGGILRDGVELIDFFHAAERLSAGVAAVYGDGTRETRHRCEELTERLRGTTAPSRGSRR